jgi:2-dehydropantoate 2-reductase
MPTRIRDCDFAILGAGALGSILAAQLARAGHRVVLLARAARAAQIEAQGVRLSGLSEITQPVEALTDPSELGSARVLIVAIKAIGTLVALEKLASAKIGAAFSVQNGVLKDVLLCRAFGASAALGAVADISGELLQDGTVVFTRNVNLLLGEVEGSTSPRAEAIARSIRDAGIRTTATAGIQSLEWSKFVGWVGLLALSTMTRAVTRKYLSNPECARLLVRLVREMAELAHRLGIELTDHAVIPVLSIGRSSEAEAVERVMEIGQKFARDAPEHRMSSLQDLEAGRPLELAETLGYALEKAAELELNLPLAASIYSLLSAIDQVR